MPFNKYRVVLFSLLSLLTVALFGLGSLVTTKQIIVIDGEPLNIFKIYFESLSVQNILLMLSILFVAIVIYFVFYHLLKKVIAKKERRLEHDKN